VACQVSALDLEMTEDAFNASEAVGFRTMHLRASLRLSLTANSASLHYQAFLGGGTKTTKWD